MKHSATYTKHLLNYHPAAESAFASIGRNEKKRKSLETEFE